jgi:hypothetical protein
MKFLSKSQQSFLKIQINILKFIWKVTGPRVSKTILIENNKTKGITLPNSNAYYVASVTKIVQ